MLAAGRVRSKKKKRNHGQFIHNTKWRIQRRNKKGNIPKYFPGVFDAGGCQLSFFSRFSPMRCPLQRRNHERYYSWISAVLMSAIKRYCRELYPQNISACRLKSAGQVRYQVSSKEHDGSSSLLLKAPYMHTGYKKKNYPYCSIRLRRQYRYHHWDFQFD